MALIIKPSKDPKVTRWWWRTLRQWVYDLVDPLWAAFRAENSGDIALTNLTSINGVTANELDALAGPVAGLAAASKVVVLDGNKDITGKRFDINQSLLDSVVGQSACYRLDGIDDNITLTGAGNNLEITNGTVEVKFSAHDLDGTQFVYGLAAPRIYISLTGTSLRVTIGDNVSNEIGTIVTETIYHVMLSWYDPDGDGNGTYNAYINGALAGTGSYSGLTSIPANPTLGSVGSSSWAHCSIYRHRAYNRVLSADEAAHYASGLSIPFSDSAAGGSGQTSGVLILGKRYRIQTYLAGDDFTNVGAASNASGVEFIVTGTTPTSWSNGSTLLRIGCVVQLEQDGIGTASWYDKSGNDLHGTVAGATPVNLPIAYVNDAGRHMLEGVSGERNVLRSVLLQITPGSTAGTNISCTNVTGSTRGFNVPAISTGSDIAKGGAAGSFALSADGKTISMDIAEDIVGSLGATIVTHDLNASSTSEVYFLLVGYTAGTLTLVIKKRASTSDVDWTTVLKAGDYFICMLQFITSS